VAARFDASIHSDSVTGDSFTLESAYGPVAATVLFDGETATLDPDASLLPATEYTATLHDAITDTDGEPIDTFSWSFYTDGPGWDAAQAVESDNTGHALAAKVGVDASGKAVAVWRQTDGSNYNVMANHFSPGAGWGTPALLENNNAGNATDIALSVNAAGHAVAVWRQTDGGANSIWANQYTPGTGWDSASAIEPTTGSSNDPQVGVDAQGNAVVVWRRSAGLVSDIWANRYTVGSGWGSAEMIESDGVETALDPRVAVSSAGNATAVWRHGDGVQFNHFTQAAGWGSPAVVADGSIETYTPRVAQLIESNTTESVQNPEVALADDGTGMVVWSQNDGTRHNVFANRYTASGWGTPELIETNDAGYALDPRVVMGSDGHAAALWREYDGARYNIAANWFSPGAGWDSPLVIEAHDAGSALETPGHTVAADPTPQHSRVVVRADYSAGREVDRVEAPFIERDVDIGKGDGLRGAGQSPATGVAFLGNQQPGLPQSAQHAPHDDRVGAGVVGNIRRGTDAVGVACHVAERVQRERQSAIAFQRPFSATGLFT